MWSQTQNYMTEQELRQDKFDKKMAKLSPLEVKAMTDDEVLGYLNGDIEANLTGGLILRPSYFKSEEEHHQIVGTLVERAHIAYERRGDIVPRPAAYIDIDGTLLDKHCNPAECLHEFVEYILEHFVCFWLTSHECDGDVTHLFQYLRDRGVPEETRALMTEFWPSHWDILKVEAINFKGDFIWFEDQPSSAELEILNKNGKSESIYIVDRAKGNGLCEWLKTQKNISHTKLVPIEVASTIKKKHDLFN